MEIVDGVHDGNSFQPSCPPYMGQILEPLVPHLLKAPASSLGRSPGLSSRTIGSPASSLARYASTASPE